MIRLASLADVASIMNIVRSAQLALRGLDIDQWQDGYPTQDIIEADISMGVGYVACDDNGVVVGYAAIVVDGEPAYHQSEFVEWHTDDDYVVVHRLCVDASARRKGVAVSLMEYAANHARKQGINTFRIDTHEGNIYMRAMLAKLGFEYCGIVFYPSGKRIGFDLKFD